VVTRTNNRSVIEEYLERHERPKLHFIYYDLPAWIRALKKGTFGIQIYYYLWQIGAYLRARKLHCQIRFSIVHHVTFGKYWTPSLMCLLPSRFIWGPVGGADPLPAEFRATVGVLGKLIDRLRRLGQWVGEHDPLVRLTARRSDLALVVTRRTGEKVMRMGARRVELFLQVGLTEKEISALGELLVPEGPPFRFISIGRLIYWKGFDLGLRAFARLGSKDWEFYLVGDGPERRRLETLSAHLGISDKVRFLGQLPRPETLRALGAAHVLLHPSLHDSGGWVCAEAMAAGRPVVCLDLGGPPTIIGEDAGFAVPAHNPEMAVEGLAEFMERLAGSSELRDRLGQAGKDRIVTHFDWRRKGAVLREMMTE